MNYITHVITRMLVIFYEKGALGRDHDNYINGHAKDWDWRGIEQTSRQLKYQLQHKLAVKKMGRVGY